VETVRPVEVSTILNGSMVSPMADPNRHHQFQATCYPPPWPTVSGSFITSGGLLLEQTEIDGGTGRTHDPTYENLLFD